MFLTKLAKKARSCNRGTSSFFFHCHISTRFTTNKKFLCKKKLRCSIPSYCLFMQIRFNKKKTLTTLGRKKRIKKKRPYKKTTKKKIFLISSEPFLFLIFLSYLFLYICILHCSVHT